MLILSDVIWAISLPALCIAWVVAGDDAGEVALVLAIYIHTHASLRRSREERRRSTVSPPCRDDGPKVLP